MTAVEQDWVVTEPGVVDGMPAAVYHADPVRDGSLSHSGARLLLPPWCPALYLYRLTHPEPVEPSPARELGSAAHALVLGVGPQAEPVDADDWRGKAAQQRRAEIRAAGGVPLLREQFAQVQAMAAALRAHPIAAALLAESGGAAEQSAFWIDEASGVWRRARFDWLPNPGPGRLIVPDYKTAISAHPAAFARAAANFSYHMQAAWYLDAAQALELGEDPAFLFVVQEKAPPYLVTVVQLDQAAERAGRARNRRAIDRYTECLESGVWPGYARDVVLVSLPPWAERDNAQEDW